MKRTLPSIMPLLILAGGPRTGSGANSGRDVRSTSTAFLLSLLILVAVPAVAAEITVQAETVAQHAVRRLSEDPAGDVAKCKSKAPSLRRDFEKAMSQRRSRIDAIAKDLLAEPRFEPATRENVSTAVVSFHRYMEGEAVPIFPRTNAKRYCKDFLKRLRTSDVDEKSLISNLEQAIAKIQDANVILSNEIR